MVVAKGAPINPFRTAVPLWGQITWNLSGLSPKRDCGSKRVNSTPPTFLETSHYLKIEWHHVSGVKKRSRNTPSVTNPCNIHIHFPIQSNPTTIIILNSKSVVAPLAVPVCARQQCRHYSGTRYYPHTATIANPNATSVPSDSTGTKAGNRSF